MTKLGQGAATWASSVSGARNAVPGATSRDEPERDARAVHCRLRSL